jgi:Kef-type K+ transport system membrane component KefB
MDGFFNTFLHEFKTPLTNPVLIFSLILFIILIFPLLLKKINIPGIIGLILAGVFIGPHGLNILEKNSAVDLFSTIGLLYIMFIAGLELDLNEFNKNKHKSILFGFFTFALPLTIGFPICYYFLEYDFFASLLTASMFSTHTLVAYPIVSRMGVSKNEAVAITVGGTILTDTAVLLLLAVIIGSYQGGLNQEFWIRLIISLTVFFVFMFTIAPRIAKWFFSKLESEKHSHYIFVLAVVFFAAFLAQVAGVEPIIGAFVAGLTLNRLIPASSALMNRIDFIGNAIFIPFFLISVGMIVNLEVINNGPTALIVAGTLTIVALTGKWIAAWITQLVFKFSGAQRRLIFGLSSSHAAATLAVILVGYKNGILDENILNGTILLILITCVVASIVSEKAAKRIVLTSDEEGYEEKDINGINNEHILLPIANMMNIGNLLDFAVFIKNKKAPNPITLLSVVSNNDEAEANIRKARIKLQSIAQLASASETKANVITTIDHNTASGIARTSREILADIIILGWPQKEGMIDKFLGEKTKGILNSTNKTTFICHFVKPLIAHKRLVLIMPPLAELESGFMQWLSKITKLATELSLPMVAFGAKKSEEAVFKCVRKYKLNSKIAFNLFDDWDDLVTLSKQVRPDDILVLVSARSGSVSHISVLDRLPAKLEKHWGESSRIIIYPQQFSALHTNERYEDINPDSLSKGFETIQKIGKEFGNIFTKGSHD